MELRHLRYFVAVAEELNYRRASERLHVSQPALSKQVKDLELELQARLLDRDTAHVRLTDAGRALLPEARAILARVAAAVATTRDASQGRSGQLAVGNIAAISASFMSASLLAFRRKFPRVDVTLVELNSQEQVAAVAAGTIQIGFTIGSIVSVPASLAYLKILSSPLRAAIGRSHRLARRPRVSLSDLAGETILYLSDAKESPRHLHLIRELFSSRGLRAGPAKAVGGFDSLIASVASGAGISFLPELTHSSRTLELRLKPLQESGADLDQELWVLWHRQEASPLAKNYVEILRRLSFPPGRPRQMAAKST